MLHLYDKNKNKIKGLRAYKDYCIESELSNGDSTLSFLYPVHLSDGIEEEGYIQSKKGEFVIKEITANSEYNTIIATMNVEDLEGKPWESFETITRGLQETLNLVCAGTGWTAKVIDSITKKRTIRMVNSSSWQIIQEIRKTFRVEFEFDTLNKVIKVYNKRGNDKGAYFIDSLNLRELEKQSNSYDFYTRIVAIGATDEKGNLIKVELKNNSYSDKVKTFIWKDERYTDIDSLREDAELKLEEISKPYKSYSADIIDLAALNAKYKEILSYSIGDTVTLIDKSKGIRDKQRIVKVVEFPEEPELNSCELANITLSFKDIQKEEKDIFDTVNNITTDNGTISEGAISSTVLKLTADKINVSELNAVKASIGELDVNKLNVEEAKIKFAEIDKAVIGKAEIVDLEAATANIKVLEASTASIKDLLAGNITAGSGQIIHLTSKNVVIDDLVVKDLIAKKISVADLIASNIDTNRFNIVGSNGNLLIKDNTIQIKDSTRVRVQIGKDASNDYSMYVWDSSGKLMFDAAGLKADGIKNKIIRDDMISDNANINGKKVDISSLVTEVNKDANTQLIKASKVSIDLEGQTLDLAFNNLKTIVNDTEEITQALQTNIEIEQGKIEGLIKNTTIGEGENTVTLKDDYTSFKLNQNSFNLGLNSNYSSIENKLNGALLKNANLFKNGNLDSGEPNLGQYNIEKTFDYVANSSGDKFFRITTNPANPPNGIKRVEAWAWTPYIMCTSGGKYKLDMKVYAPTENLYYKVWGVIGSTTLFKFEGETTSRDKNKPQILSVEFTIPMNEINELTMYYGVTTADKDMDICIGNVKIIALEGLADSLSIAKDAKAEIIKTNNKVSEIVGTLESITTKVESTEKTIINTITPGITEAINKADSANKTANQANNTLIETNKKLGEVEVKANGVTTKVESLEEKEIKTRKVSAFRYIRDYLKGNSINTGNHWVELAVLVKNENVALGKEVISNGTISNSERITDGSVDTNLYGASYGEGSKWIYAQIDLGEVRNDIDMIKVWHYYSDGRTYNHRLEVSRDGEVWFELFNSEESGSYSESKDGRTYVINESYIESRVKLSEQKITDDAIINTVKSSQTDGKNTFAQTSVVEQLVNQVKYDFSTIGSYNYFKKTIFGTKLGSLYIELWRDNLEGFDSRSPAYKFKLNNGASWRFPGMVTKNGTYSMSFYAKRISGPSHINLTMDLCDRTGVTSDRTVTLAWKHFKIENITVDNFDSTYNFLDLVFSGGSGTGNYEILISHMCINEGTTAMPWVPNSNEIQDGNTIINADGVTVTNGALTIKNNAGSVVMQGDSAGNLSLTGTFNGGVINGAKVTTSGDCNVGANIVLAKDTGFGVAGGAVYFGRDKKASIACELEQTHNAAIIRYKAYEGAFATHIFHGKGQFIDGLNVTGETYLDGSTYLKNTLYLHGRGTNYFSTGNGDDASFATHNLRLHCHWGLGIEDNNGLVRTVYDARSGFIYHRGNIRLYDINGTVYGFEAMRSGGRFRISAGNSNGALRFEEFSSTGLVGVSSIERGKFYASASFINEDARMARTLIKEDVTIDDVYSYIKSSSKESSMFRRETQSPFHINVDEIPTEIFDAIGIITETEIRTDKDADTGEDIEVIIPEQKLLSISDQTAMIQNVLSIALNKIERLENEILEMKEAIK